MKCPIGPEPRTVNPIRVSGLDTFIVGDGKGKPPSKCHWWGLNHQPFGWKVLGQNIIWYYYVFIPTKGDEVSEKFTL